MDLDGKTILLTGGTGSFGSAFARYAARELPRTTVRIFSRDELKQSELRTEIGDDQFRYFIGDIRDRSRLTRACEGADLILHTAAMKQVPACEYNPSEAIMTNVSGSQNIVDAAIDSGVELVVALSTDKAVNPVNLYGATKLCAEKVVVQGNAYAANSNTRLACVRYGNVVGSRGSIVPLFREQARTGQLTITDERMTRFWITLPQAIALVRFAVANAVGGEVFIPRLPSTRVTDLADVIAPGVPREIIGIRPGEKLHEVMLTTDESRHAVALDDVFVVLPEHPWWNGSTNWTDGKPLEEGFAYASNTNDWWLTHDEIAALLP